MLRDKAERLIFISKARWHYGNPIIKRAIKSYKDIEIYSVKLGRIFFKFYGVPLRGPIKGRVFDREMKKYFPIVFETDKKIIPQIREIVWEYKNWDDHEKRKRQRDRIVEEGGPLPYHEYEEFRRYGRNKRPRVLEGGKKSANGASGKS